MKALLGARGAHKCEMANLGLPVAPGFCITSKCLQRAEDNEGLPLSGGARNNIKVALSELEDASERRFGNLVDPLLLSIEGHLKSPMCGFSGTIANIGLNDAIVQAWTAHTSPHFVWDSYRRLISMYSRAVRRLDMEPFEEALREVKDRLNAQCQLGREHADCHIPTHELRNLVETYKDLFQEQTGEPFPQDPMKQLWEAVHAASRSWDQEQDDCAEAVTVQSTIFSNFDFKSAVGMTFKSVETEDDDSLDESLAPEISGKWLINAQSEDMACDRIPQEVTQEASFLWAEQQGVAESHRQDEFPSLEEAMPGVFAKLLRFQDIVDNHFSDVHGLEFAIHQGKLWFLEAHTDEDALREHPFLKRSMASQPMQEVIEEREDTFACLEQEALPEPMPELVVESSFDGWQEFLEELPLSTAEPSDDQSSLCSAPLEQGEGLDVDTVGSMLSIVSSKVQLGGKCQPLFSTPNAMMWRALQRLSRRHKQTAIRPSASSKGTEQAAASAEASKRGLVPPCGLALWQTALAGGAAAVACRGLGMSIEQLEAAKLRPSVGNSPSLARALSLQHSFRGLASPVRAFPFGAVCCTFYTNLCSATPADESAVCRLGCAAGAVFSATAITHAAASGGRLWFPKVTTLMPTMAIEMCTIDLVKNAAAERGYDATPGVLVASGAVAGTVAQSIMHPLKALCRQAELPAIAGSGASPTAALSIMRKEGASALFAGLGPACMRSMPIVAMNSLVRVGMTTYFLSEL